MTCPACPGRRSRVWTCIRSTRTWPTSRRRAAARLAPQFQDAQVTLIVNADTALPVHVDPDRITQVLTNLLGNALLATPAGGTVTVTARPTARGGEVVVTDTGVGLSEQDVERVFERFYRAPGQPRRSAGSGYRPDDRPWHRPRPRRGRHRIIGRSRAGRQLHPGPAVALTPSVRYRRARRQLTAPHSGPCRR